MASFLDVCKLPLTRFQKLKLTKNIQRLHQNHTFSFFFLFSHSQANMKCKEYKSDTKGNWKSPLFSIAEVNFNCSYQLTTDLHINNHNLKVQWMFLKLNLRLQQHRSNFPEQQKPAILQLCSLYKNNWTQWQNFHSTETQKLIAEQ